MQVVSGGGRAEFSVVGFSTYKFFSENHFFGDLFEIAPLGLTPYLKENNPNPKALIHC